MEPSRELFEAEPRVREQPKPADLVAERAVDGVLDGRELERIFGLALRGSR